jgi:hypothetical protein
MTKENYERSLTMPLGAEYNTLASFQALTTPRVEAKVLLLKCWSSLIRKVGTVINPLGKKKQKPSDRDEAKVGSTKNSKQTSRRNNNNG